MRKRDRMTAILCSLCLSVSMAVPAVVAADETESVTESAETEEMSDAGLEESTEAESEAGVTAAEEITAEELALMPRPEYTASDYVTLGEYRGLKVSVESVKVTDEEIDEAISRELQSSDLLETLTEGTVQEGDTANIDYEGKKDGVAFDGGTAKGYDLVIGSGNFIDGFEDGLIGVSVGETVDLPLTFPENYGNAELAGQDVVFTVTVNEIGRAPELTDEVAGRLTDGEYPDVASYRESVRAELEAEKEQEKEDTVRANLLTQVANVCEITGYPQEMVDYNVAQMTSYYRTMAQWNAMEFEDYLSAYLQMTPEQFREAAAVVCREILQQEMYLKAIAEAEGIEVSEEEYAAGTEEYARQYGYETAEELIAANDEGEIRTSLLLDKVYDFLEENAVLIEEAEAESESEVLTGAELATEAEPES